MDVDIAVFDAPNGPSSAASSFGERTQLFKQLFRGFIGMVEKPSVCMAISDFHTALISKDTDRMKNSSLAHEIASHQKMADSWSLIRKLF